MYGAFLCAISHNPALKLLQMTAHVWRMPICTPMLLSSGKQRCCQLLRRWAAQGQPISGGAWYDLAQTALQPLWQIAHSKSAEGCSATGSLTTAYAFDGGACWLVTGTCVKLFLLEPFSLSCVAFSPSMQAHTHTARLGRGRA